MQKYEILSVIGQGAYGVVLKCKSNQSNETVAIKKFKQSEDDELVRKVTMREVKILKNMKNNNIVQLRDAFRRKGIVYLVFQYVQNNLLQILEKYPDGLDPQIIKNVIYQLLKGLAYMHSNNVIHRDIKPENLLISQNYQLKICDFGFARTYKKPSQQYSDYVATRWYRPPQLLVGAPYDASIDIWAVGCIMAELIDGNPLFPGQNQFDQLFLIQKCLGNLTSQHNQILLKNPRFIGMKFPQIKNLETIQKKYLGKLSQKALNFLKSTLKLNPSQRLSAIEALKHPYFESIRQRQMQRKQSGTHSYPKGQNRISNSLKEDNVNSVSYERKKIQTNMYNPPLPNSNVQRQKTQDGHHHYQENLFLTKGGKFYQQSLNNGPSSKPNRKSKQEIKVFQLTTKGFNPMIINGNAQSKSLNKPGHVQSNYAHNLKSNQGHHQATNPSSKITKLKQKYISLEKGQQVYNKRDHVTQTQAGFYKNKAIKIQFPQHDDINLPQQNNKKKTNATKNQHIAIDHNIYNKQHTNLHNQTQSKSRNAKNRSIVNTQQIYEQEEGTFSSGQLPFLMVSSQHTHGSNPKQIHNQSGQTNQAHMAKNRQNTKQQQRQKHNVNPNAIKSNVNHNIGLQHHMNNTYLNNIHDSNQPNSNLHIIISNSIFNNYTNHNRSSNKNY